MLENDPRDLSKKQRLVDNILSDYPQLGEQVPTNDLSGFLLSLDDEILIGLLDADKPKMQRFAVYARQMLTEHDLPIKQLSQGPNQEYSEQRSLQDAEVEKMSGRKKRMFSDNSSGFSATQDDKGAKSLNGKAYYCR